MDPPMGVSSQTLWLFIQGTVLILSVFIWWSFKRLVKRMDSQDELRTTMHGEILVIIQRLSSQDANIEILRTDAIKANAEAIGARTQMVERIDRCMILILQQGKGGN